MIKLQPLKQAFKHGTDSIGLTRATDRELMMRSFNALKHEIDLENNMGAPKLTRRFHQKGLPLLSAPYNIEVILTNDNEDHLIGYFKVTHAITQSSDLIDFIVKTCPNNEQDIHATTLSQKHEKKYDSRHVKLTFPHWRFPEFITTPEDRMAAIHTLHLETKERCGIESSLKGIQTLQQVDITRQLDNF